MTTITVVWSMWHDDPDLSAHLLMQGRQPVTEATIYWDATTQWGQDPWISNVAVCEMLFEQTNLYEGPLWDMLEPILPEYRSHTALSVGDYVVVDGVSYRCDRVGWTAAERPSMSTR